MRYEKKGAPLAEQEKEQYLQQGISPIVAELLAARGIGPKEADEFLAPGWAQVGDPFLFSNMEKVCERIRQAVLKKEQVAVYSDYDCDGVCGAAILQKTLKALGIAPKLYIPDRQTEGYGTNAAAFERLIEQGVSLILTVDCGIRSVSDVALAKGRGVDCIIIDHHECGELPDTPYLLNCKMPGERYPFHDLCGAGTAFKLAQALLGGRAEELVDLCGVATIGDMVGLLGENRALAYLGLEKLRQAPCLGFRALAKAAGIRLAGVRSYGVAFGLVPRINAAGRLEHASLALRLLLAEDLGEAEELAQKLSAVNARRQELQQQITQQAAQFVREGVCLAEAKILFVAGEGWEKGVVGLAASSISQMFYRPAVVLAQEGELLTGSARSIAGINLYEALCQAEHLYERFGGHEMAAGLTIKRENLAEAQRLVENFLKEKYPDSVFVPVCQYDEEIALAQADIGLAEQLERMQPFGQENEEPRFFISGFSPLSIAAMGKNREHLKMQAADCASEILRFSAREEIELGGQYDFVASFSINEFRGNRKSQLVISSIQRQDVSDWQGKLELEYLRQFPAEAYAYAAYCRTAHEHVLKAPQELEEWFSRYAGWPLGAAAFCTSQSGARLLQELAGRLKLPWLQQIQAGEDSAQSCLCFLQKEGLKNYKKTLALGGFCALHANPQAAVYLGEDLREAYRQEAKRFYDPGLFGELLKVFAQMEGVYSSVSEFLEKAAGTIGLQDIRKPWLIFQALFGQKLLEVRKSDKIIHIHLKEEGAFCPEQSGYFRAIRDLADGKV